MEPLLFADHLRTLRQSSRADRPGRSAGLNLAGAGRLVGAACAACLLLVMLQAAISGPAVPGAPMVAQLQEEVRR